jgi:hypothetical protein
MDPAQIEAILRESEFLSRHTDGTMILTPHFSEKNRKNSAAREARQKQRTSEVDALQLALYIHVCNIKDSDGRITQYGSRALTSHLAI